jgi:inosine/xanthosine triphosphatase
METIRIAVGSKRTPKVEAVRQALKSLGPLLRANATFEVTGFEVATGVGHTPLSRDELMAGARGRCEAVMRASGYGEAAAYFVGLEGGLDVVRENGVRENGRRLAFLQSWAFVADAGGRGFYGQSGAILLPEALAAEVLDRGAELSQAIEAFTGTTGVRDSQGAWGVLTKNLIDRQESFRIAVISAFAPFFNAEMYGRGRVLP